MLNSVALAFENNSADVERLINFDRQVLDLVIMHLESLHNDLKATHASDQRNGGRVLAVVKSIRSNESLRSRYEVIYGQAVVLLVSYFASALGDIFRVAVNARLERGDNDALLDEEMKLTFREMRDRDWTLKGTGADFLIAKKDYTFQDMQSVSRAFSTYLSISPPKDGVTNDIILGQAARHVIVHSGAVATERMLRQVSGANPRVLKPDVKLGDRMNFRPDEVRHLTEQMKCYISRTISEFEALP